MRSVSPSDKSSAALPSGGRCTSSSMRTPPSPARYTPGSTVTTAPPGRGSALVFASRGASCTSSPSPCPSECPNASPRPRAAIGSRASASASRPLIPARTPPRPFQQPVNRQLGHARTHLRERAAQGLPGQQGGAANRCDLALVLRGAQPFHQLGHRSPPPGLPCLGEAAGVVHRERVGLVAD